MLLSVSFTWELNKSERGNFSFTGTKDVGKWRMKQPIPCDPLINPSSLFTELGSPNSYPNPLPLSSLLVIHSLDFLKLLLTSIYLRQILFSFCMASPLLPLSLNVINATSVVLFVCCLEMLTRALTCSALPTSSALPSQGPPLGEPGFQHFPKRTTLLSRIAIHQPHQIQGRSNI